MNLASDFWPENEPVKRGDPYLAEIVTADDLITDHRYNFEFLGMSEAEGDASAERIERARLSYELEALYRWWTLAPL